MPHTAAWNELAPAGSDLASSIDNFMREMKRDIRERLSVDLIWNTSVDHDGKHLKITFRPAADTRLMNVESANTITTALAGAIMNFAQTWNASGLTVDAIKVNITDTASDAASSLLDLQVGGVSKFKIRKDGALMAGGQSPAGSSSSVVQPGGGIVFSSQSQVLYTGGGAEQALLTKAIPAGLLATNGASLRFRFFGLFANNSNPMRLRVKFGSTIFMDVGPGVLPVANALGSYSWGIDGSIVRRGATSQVAFANMVPAIFTGGLAFPTETLSGAVDLTLTGEAVMNNDITLEGYQIEYLPPGV